MTEPTDTEFEAALRRSAKRRGLIVYGSCGLVLAGILGALAYAWIAHAEQVYEASHPGGWLRYELTTEEKAELARAVGAARSQIILLDAGWRPAIDAVDPTAGSSGDSCPDLASARMALLANPQGSEWGDWEIGALPLPDNEATTASLTRTPFPLTFVGPQAARPAVSPEARVQIARLEQRAALDTVAFSARMQAVTAGTPAALATTDVLVQLVELVPPVHTGPQSFTAGTVTAQVWAYDHARHAVVCAGVVHAESTDEVHMGTTNLAGDLLTNLVRAVPLRLHPVAVAERVAVAPPMAVDGVLEVTEPGAGRRSRMTLGRVRNGAGAEPLQLELGSADLADCAGHNAGPIAGARVSAPLPAGPGGTFYDGAPFGVPVGIDGSLMSATYSDVTVSTPMIVAGGHVKGTMDLGRYGRGAFDAVVCPDVRRAAVHALAKRAPDQPLSGAFAGTPFAVKSAIAVLDVPSPATTVVSYIDLFAAAGVTCANRDAARGASLRLTDLGGAGTDRHRAGVPQPAIAGGRLAPEADATPFGVDDVWVELDAFVVEPGKILAGRAVVAGPSGSLGGTFHATVCPP